MATPEDVGASNPQALVYTNGGTFSDSFTGRSTTTNNPKYYTFRVTRGNPVFVTLVKTSGSTSLRFEVGFSDTDDGDFTTDVACAAHAVGTDVQCDDPGTSTGDGWARIKVYVTALSATANYDLSYDAAGPCAATGHPCYAQDVTRITNVPHSTNKKPMIEGSLPRMYAGQTATITFTRSNSHVVFASGEPVKLKYDGVNEQYLDFTCDAWTNNVRTCTSTVALSDGEIHAAMHRTNTGTGTNNYYVDVEINRSDVASTGYVQTDRTWHF